MDWLVWIIRGAGACFGILTLALAMSRASAFSERDISPLWWLAFIGVGGVWVVALAVDWMMPIASTVYLANGSNVDRQVRIDTRVICLPAKSYDGFNWRFDLPQAVYVRESGSTAEQRYPVGKGTWLINTSSVMVSADMYQHGQDAIDFDALFSPRAGATQVSSRQERPFRMFSQSSLDRVYSGDGDVLERSEDGPCQPQGGKK